MASQANCSLLKVIGKDFRISGNGHEVGGAVPSRDDVPVEVIRNPGAGGHAQVHADVEPIRLHRFLQRLHASLHQALHVQRLVVLDLLELTDVAERGYHQVTAVVRVLVQHGERQLASRHDQGLLVVAFLRLLAEQAPLILALAGLADVLHPPGRPQPFHYRAPTSPVSSARSLSSTMARARKASRGTPRASTPARSRTATVAPCSSLSPTTST